MGVMELIDSIVIEVKSLNKNLYLSDLIKDKNEYKKIGIVKLTKRIKDYQICLILIDLINQSGNVHYINLGNIVMGDSSGKFHMFEKRARNKNNVDYKILHYLRNNIDERFAILPYSKTRINLVYPCIDNNIDIIKFAYRYNMSLSKDWANKHIEEFKISGGII